MAEDNSRLVYSTEHPVPRKERPAARTFAKPGDPSKARIMVRLDRKRRGGKSVTVIEGLQVSVVDGEKLLKALKAKLGTGGTVKDGALEIQGEHCAAVSAELQGLGYKVKRLGK
jgi:translation initiation factor 1